MANRGLEHLFKQTEVAGNRWSWIVLVVDPSPLAGPASSKPQAANEQGNTCKYQHNRHPRIHEPIVRRCLGWALPPNPGATRPPLDVGVSQFKLSRLHIESFGNLDRAAGVEDRASFGQGDRWRERHYKTLNSSYASVSRGAYRGFANGHALANQSERASQTARSISALLSRTHDFTDAS